MTIAEAARMAGVSRSTLYRSIRDKKLEAVLSNEGGKRVRQAEVLAKFKGGDSEPEGGRAANATSAQIESDPELVEQLQNALDAEHAKVQQLQRQLATVDAGQDVAASTPAPRQHQSPRRRWKLVRSLERTFDVLAGGTLIIVVALAIIIALVFSFGGFTGIPTISEF